MSRTICSSVKSRLAVSERMRSAALAGCDQKRRRAERLQQAGELPVSVKKHSLYAILCPALWQQKVLCTPWFGSLQAFLPKSPLLRRSVSFTDAGIVARALPLGVRRWPGHMVRCWASHTWGTLRVLRFRLSVSGGQTPLAPTASCQNFDPWKWTLRNLPFRRACLHENKQAFWDLSPSIWIVANWNEENWPYTKAGRARAEEACVPTWTAPRMAAVQRLIVI